ncbi:hypothetical protein [Streptomyces sp. MI02-7b]|uniref:hypothetical protein n=1 Tax=Streptomyces sp. MI02-7b TaxID=462941 RepID=UPI0029ADC59C|nr:hypothetical protein [Streptomyces sp. MI02-7b]MDX3075786.1 hypothetical protein [Streptomyces sp. MI02-7b]
MSPATSGSAVRATVFSTTGTALAVVVHHLSFDQTPSWGRRLLAVSLAFLLLLPGCRRPSTPGSQLLMVLSAQAVISCCFATSGYVVEAGWIASVYHLVATLAVGCLLHSADSVLSRAVRLIAPPWRGLCAFLHRLLRPVPIPHVA